jgi:glucosamine kinase
LSREVVIGIDGGGTHTRVVVADLEGKILGFAKGKGVHPGKNKTPAFNVKNTIAAALETAHVPLKAVVQIVAGFAGLNKPEDMTWAESYLEINGLRAKKTVVNDAVIAQFGAFLGEPGVIAVSGTGSNVVGKTESGKIHSNRNFHHLPHASARYLSYSVIYDLISKKENIENEALTSKIFHYWNVTNIAELRNLVASGFNGYELDAIKELSNMAVFVTEAALNENQLAQKACEKVARELFIGICLVASTFTAETVPVSFIGSVANAQPVKDMLLQKMEEGDALKKLTYKEPELPPMLGAVYYGIQKQGIELNEKVIEKWKREFKEH